MKKLFSLFLFWIAFFALDFAHAANKFAFCTTACTWDTTNTPNIWFTATGGGGSPTTIPGSGDFAIFDGATCAGGLTCTITAGTDISGTTLLGFTAGACTASTTGCILDFSVNNPSFTLTNVSSFSGTGTRKFLFGTGTWTFTSTSQGTLYDLTTTTNLDATSVLTNTIIYSGNSTVLRTFAGGGRTYGTFSILANTARHGIVISGANTFGTLSIANGTWVQIPAGATTTISNAPTITGTSALPVSFQSSNINVGVATISVSSGTVAFDYTAFFGITGTGGATFTATNSYDLGRNTNIGFPAWSAGGGGRIIGG